MRYIIFLAILLSSCAGRVPGNAVWTTPANQTPPQYDYGFPTGPLIGRVVQNPDGTWKTYGCNGESSTQPTLSQAEQVVATSCANANK